MKPHKTFALTIALMAMLALINTACSKGGGGSSPTATAKAFYDAAKSKDVQGMKNALSKGSLAVMESFAKLDNKSLDEMLKEPSGTPPATFESRNEVIKGDTATLEVKNNKGAWEKTPFVKEDGQWKLALDKALEEGFITETSPSTPPAGNTPTSPGSNSSSPGMGANTSSNTNGNANSDSEADDKDESNKNNGEHGSH